MVKKIVSMALPEETIKRLDTMSKALGISRSKFVDMMLKKGFKFSKETEKALNKISDLQEKAKKTISD